eukprot:742536-Rhodomonas_salina.1
METESETGMGWQGYITDPDSPFIVPALADMAKPDEIFDPNGPLFLVPVRFLDFSRCLSIDLVFCASFSASRTSLDPTCRSRSPSLCCSHLLHRDGSRLFSIALAI